MSYTKRTCTECGWRDIQPNMRQVEIEYVSGSSKQKADIWTWLGAGPGNKVAERALQRAYTGGHREYKRRRKVWVCQNCTPSQSVKKRLTFSKIVKWCIFLIFFIPFMHGFLKGIVNS